MDWLQLVSKAKFGLRPKNAAQPQEMARAVHSRLDQWRGGVPAEDDQTLIVLSHNNGSDAPRMGVSQWMRSAIRVLGLQKVYTLAGLLRCCGFIQFQP